MGKPLPLETRRAIVRMVQRADCSQAEIARIFKVGERSVKRYMSMFRQTGDVDSHAKFGGHKKAKLAGHEQTIIDLLTKQPDITLQALTALLVQKNVHTSETGLFFFLKALGFGYKKNGIWSRTETQGHSSSQRRFQKAAKKT
jgi:transposase